MKVLQYICILTVFCLALLVNGCSEDGMLGFLSPDADGEDRVTLTLNVSIANSGKGATRAEELPEGFENTDINFEKINTLRVIIVRENNVVEHNRLVTMPDGIGVDRIGELDFKVSTDLSELVQNSESHKWYRTEKKYIYLVANEASIPSEPGIVGEVKDLLLNLNEGEEFTPTTAEKLIIYNEWSTLSGSTEEEVKTDKLATPFIDNDKAGVAKKYVPMSEFFEISVTENVSDGKTKQEHTENLFITRNLVKFRFSIDVDNMDRMAFPFKVKSITFNKVMQKEYLFPNSTEYNPPKYNNGNEYTEGSKVEEKPHREITMYNTPPFAGDQNQDRDGNHVRPYVFTPTDFGFKGGSLFPSLELELPEGFATLEETYSPALYFCETKTLDGDADNASLFSVGIEVEFPWDEEVKDAEGKPKVDEDGKPVTQTVTRIFEPQVLDNLLDGLPRNTIVDVKMSLKNGELTATATVFPYTGVWLNPEFGVIVEPTGVMIDMVDADEDGFIKISKGNTYWLAANITPDDATETTLTWSSDDPDIATVDDNGMVTAVKEGDATITVQTSNYDPVKNPDVKLISSCKIKVTPEVLPSQIIFDSPSATILEGETLLLNPVVLEAEAANKALTWNSSKTNVATVDEHGKITAVNEGTTIITATSVANQDITATCEVTVIKVKLADSVTLSQHDATITPELTYNNKGEITGVTKNTLLLYASILPADATNTTLTWSSDNNSVATVENGFVKALSNGTANITVRTSNNKFDTCKVTVSGTEDVTVTLDKHVAVIGEGTVLFLNAVLYPETTTIKSVTWSSSDNEVAPVDKGFVTGLKTGTATITVTTSNGAKDDCRITVTNVTLNKYQATLEIDGTQQLTATIAPDNVAGVKKSWSSSEPEVATVSSTGLVTAKKYGNATITVTTTYTDPNSNTETILSTANCEISVPNDSQNSIIIGGNQR